MTRTDRILLGVLTITLVTVAAVVPRSSPAAQAAPTVPPKIDLLDHEAPSTTTLATTTTTLAPTTTTTAAPPETTVATEAPTTTEPVTEPPTDPPTTARRVVRATPPTEAPVVTEAPPTTAVPVTEAPAAPITSGLCASKYGSLSPDWLTPATIMAGGWPEAQVSNVCKIIGCESNFHEGSWNHASNTRGLLQIMGNSLPWTNIMAAHGWTQADLFDPMVNLTVGYEGWALMGSVWKTSQWSCATVLR